MPFDWHSAIIRLLMPSVSPLSRLKLMNPAVAQHALIEIEHIDPVNQRVDLEWIRARLSDAVGVTGQPVSRISIILVNDQRMAQIHREHCGIDSTTDVLTFPISADREPIDVDLVISIDEAIRRAAEFKHAVEREILLYAVHGVLHCAGFDDHDDAGFQAMHAEEDRILRLIGVGATFEPNPPEDTGKEIA